MKIGRIGRLEISVVTPSVVKRPKREIFSVPAVAPFVGVVRLVIPNGVSQDVLSVWSSVLTVSELSLTTSIQCFVQRLMVNVRLAARPTFDGSV
jgi:hypothetical protein